MSNVIPLKQFHSVRQQSSTQEQQEAKLREAAELYEQQFLGEMVKAMRTTINHSELTEPTMAENIYKQQLDSEYVKSWVGRGGVGLSDLIVEQLKERFGMNTRPQRPSGPIPLEKKNNFKLEQTGGDEKRLDFKVQTEKGDKVTSLWNGVIDSTFRTEAGQSVVQVAHDNGMKSRLVFNGPSSMKLFDAVKGGDVLGVSLSGEVALQIFS